MNKIIGVFNGNVMSSGENSSYAIYCNKFPTKCSRCKLRFECYTDLRPTFTKEQLEKEGIVYDVNLNPSMRHKKVWK
jgi:hypothetical protein